jgi:hypothetical protein
MAGNSTDAGRDSELARATWANEIEQAIDKVKLGVTPARKRTEDEKWWRKQWYRSLMRDRKHERWAAIQRAPRRFGGEENGTN